MKNWLNPEEIEIVQPQNPEAVDAIADDLMKLISLLPKYDADCLESMREFPEQFTLVYHNSQPVAYIEINDNTSFDHLGKDSLEFGGAVLPEYRDKGLTIQVAPVVIRQAFERTGKAKMLAFVPPGNEEARSALAMLGFKSFGTHNGLCRYILKRSDALA